MALVVGEKDGVAVSGAAVLVISLTVLRSDVVDEEDAVVSFVSSLVAVAVVAIRVAKSRVKFVSAMSAKKMRTDTTDVTT